MPDSTSLTRDNSKEAIMARLGDAYGRKNAKDKTEVEEIPRWARTALIYKAIDGMTYKEAVKRVGREEKSAKTLASYGQSPAGKKWVGYLAEFIDDPIEMAKAILRGNAIGITLDRLTFLDAAIAAGDYKVGDAIAKDIQEKLGIVSPKTKSEGPATLNITIGGGAVEIPAIEVEWEEVLDSKEEDDE